MLVTKMSVCVCVCVCARAHATQSCPTFCNSMDSSLPGSSILGILQARILEWAAISISRGSSQSRDQTHISCIAGRLFQRWERMFKSWMRGGLSAQGRHLFPWILLLASNFLQMVQGKLGSETEPYLSKTVGRNVLLSLVSWQLMWTLAQ